MRTRARREPQRLLVGVVRRRRLQVFAQHGLQAELDVAAPLRATRVYDGSQLRLRRLHPGILPGSSLRLLSTTTGMREVPMGRSRHLRSIVPAVLALIGAVGCGSVTALGDGGPQTGTAGTSGSAGTSGIAGSSGVAGSSGGAGISGVSGSSGIAGTGGGGAGSSGHAGTGAAGTGAAGTGASDGGARDAPPDASACSLATMVDRSCSTDADCVAVTHTTSCCGSAVWMGIRSTEQQRFSTLETACDGSYPRCGCAAGPPQTDDGSIVNFGSGKAGVSCQGGICKTFSKACGHPCEAGRSCTTCMAPDAGAASFCTLRCMNDMTCTEPGLTRCQFTFASGICVDPTKACGGF
jgi:hypothetical protein